MERMEPQTVTPDPLPLFLVSRTIQAPAPYEVYLGDSRKRVEDCLSRGSAEKGAGRLIEEAI